MSEIRVLDPDARRLLELAAEAGHPPFEALSPAQARKAYAASWSVMQTPGGEVASALDTRIDGPGGALALRIYRGQGTQATADLPCLLFLHGGGWVIGNLDSHDRLCRRLANGAGICVVAVDYRLAPEHPFPAALDDAATALAWIAAQAKTLRIDAQRIAVGGDSAGGNLAAALALMAREGSVPPVVHQTLLYPALDLTASSDSYRRVRSGVPLTAATMAFFIGHYTPRPEDRLDWRASPLRAASLAGVAPALVLTVAHDPLCDEGHDYAQRLSEAGVRVSHVHCNDQMHGVLSQGRMVPAGDALADSLCRTIAQELHRAAPAPACKPAVDQASGPV
jgi:acetyl esterase